MAFLSQLGAQLQSLKESANLQTIKDSAPFQSLKDSAPKLINTAKSAKNGLISKVGLDSLGKMLNVNGERNQSPIDIIPVITTFGEHLQNATFRLEYDQNGDMKAVNSGNALSIRREGNESEMAMSFLPEEQYHLDAIYWHWGTEPMNGSEHTLGGVGYAGELHLVHRNTRFPSLDLALKEKDGVFAFAVFLNEQHDDNPAIAPFIQLVPNLTYKSNECRVHSFDPTPLLPPPEKTKEFWVYDGSETVEPFRESVKWVVFRSAIPISSQQLDTLRSTRSGPFDEEREQAMNPRRAIQPINSRTTVSSFRSAAGAPNLGFTSS